MSGLIEVFSHPHRLATIPTPLCDPFDVGYCMAADDLPPLALFMCYGEPRFLLIDSLFLDEWDDRDTGELVWL